MKTEKTPFFIGITFTAVTFIFSLLYYDYKFSPDLLKQDQKSKLFAQALAAFEVLELRYNDIKYKIKEASQTQAPVALVAIDDDSVMEIGRMPWSRDLIAEMTAKLIEYQAAAVGFDIIFSEPDKANPTADQKLADLLSQQPDKVILGTFSETPFISQNHYQDYCLNEVFKKNYGEEIVKLNASLIVDDETDNYDNLNWESLFTPILNDISKQTEQETLLLTNKKTTEDLHIFQKNALELKKIKNTFHYCSEWLTSNDTYYNSSNIKLKNSLNQSLFSLFSPNTPYEFEKLTSILNKFKRESFLNPILQYTYWTPNIKEVQKNSQYTASFVAYQDRDGYVRRYPLLYRTGNRLGLSYIPSLALQTYLLAKNYRAEIKISKPNSVSNSSSNSSQNSKVGFIEKIFKTFSLNKNKDRLLNEKIVSEFKIIDSNTEKLIQEIPIDSSGRLLIHYYGKQMSLPYIPAKELFSSQDTMNIYLSTNQKNDINKNLIEVKTVNKKDFLKGRSVIIGATAIGLYDLRTTPLEANYPGPEIHLTALANLLDSNFYKTWKSEKLLFPWIILLAGILFSYFWAHVGAITSFLSFIFLFFVIIMTDFYIFFKQQYVFAGFVILLILTTITNFSITFFNYFTEEGKKKQLKSTFSKYVAPAVVEELLKSEDNLKLGGKRQRMSVFFSDVRGFTTISEKLAPEELSRVLNMYLTPMTEIVFKNKGTLDKYIGDAIMAFFGAPIFDKNHARQACQCALESLEKLSEIQKRFAEDQLPHIDIGIGINTGEMSVGNMGSNIVQNYTVMGDSVNLASRLEGITKEYGVRIVISEFTQKEVNEFFITREIDKVKVKGKNQPVAIFELIAEKTKANATKQEFIYLDHFNSGYELYMKKDFSAALNLFLKATEINPNDKVSKVFKERCEEFIQSPPEENWDGVFTMTKK